MSIDPVLLPPGTDVLPDPPQCPVIPDAPAYPSSCLIVSDACQEFGCGRTIGPRDDLHRSGGKVLCASCYRKRASEFETYRPLVGTGEP